MRRRTLAICIATLTVTLAGLSVPALAAPRVPAARSAALPGACRKSFDPYRASQAQLRSCGDAIYPLIAVKHLAGGGQKYVYSINGARAVTRIAPTGFKPLHASASKLAEYGFPPRPSGGRALRSWQAMMRHETQLSPARYLVGVSSAAGAFSMPSRPASADTADVFKVVTYVWGGNMAVSNTFTNVYATYDEPNTSTAAACGTPQEEGMWAGLGGYFSGDVAQDGTAVGESGIGNHQAWLEIVPTKKATAISGLYATVGRSFTAQVIREPGGFYFYLHNGYTGKSYDITIASSAYDASSAEAVMEIRAATPIPKFSTFDVIDAEAAANYGSYAGIASGSHYALEGYSYTIATNGVRYRDQVVKPGPANVGGYSWNMDYLTCY